MTSYIEAAQAACDAVGIVYRKTPTGEWSVTDATDKPPKNGNGRIKPFSDGTGGMVQNWTTMDKPEPFFIDSGVKLEPAALAERTRRIKAERDQAEKELADSRKQAAATAKAVLTVAQPPAGNPYLQRKQAAPTATLREIELESLIGVINYHPQAKGKPFAAGKILIVPVRNHQGMTTVEMIDCNGHKAGLKGGQKKGGFWSTGKLPDDDGDGLIIGIGEGVATMLTYRQVFGSIGIAALSCSNLAAVAMYFRNRYPAARIEVVSDVGRGEQAATEAAQMVNGYLVKPTFPEGSTGSDINDLLAESGPEAVEACLESAALVEVVTDQAPAPVDEFQRVEEPAPPRSSFMSAIEFLQNSIQIDWSVDKRIPRNSTGQLFGPSGGGKTFNAVEMALAVATGGTTLDGHRAAQGLVLYLAGEGHDGLRRRVRAWQLHNNKSVEDLELFYLSRNTICFDAPDIRATIAEGKQLSEQHGVPIAFIVIDTLARHLEGDENNAKDMGAFIKAVDDLRSAFPGCVAMIVHHSGHGEDTKNRARGSSALKGAMDFEFCCDKGLLTVTKMKDGETPSPIEFKLHTVKIGIDDDGEPITSCVIQYGERSAKNREAELTAAERMLLGMVNDCPDILSGDLRTVFFNKRREREPEAKQDTLKRAFNRAFDGLIEKKQIFMDGHIVKTGLVTKAGHSGTCSEGVNGTDRDTPLKGCPDVPPLVPIEILTLNEADLFLEVPL